MFKKSLEFVAVIGVAIVTSVFTTTYIRPDAGKDQGSGFIFEQRVAQRKETNKALLQAKSGDYVAGHEAGTAEQAQAFSDELYQFRADCEKLNNVLDELLKRYEERDTEFRKILEGLTKKIDQIRALREQAGK